MNYTKGPWKCERVFPENASREEYHVTDGKWGGETVAICGGNQDNALLIAAAPDMLNLLHGMNDRLNDYFGITDSCEGGDFFHDEIRAVIAKAEGRE